MRITWVLVGPDGRDVEWPHPGGPRAFSDLRFVECHLVRCGVPPERWCGYSLRPRAAVAGHTPPPGEPVGAGGADRPAG